MITTLKNSFKIPEVRNKILMTLLFVLIYRVGCYIPVPGVSVSAFQSAFSGGSMSLFGIMNAITGGALSQGTLFAIGISPYINASIIVQLLTVAIPQWQEWSKNGGEEGREKLNKVTKWFTLVLAVIQSVGVLLTLKNYSSQSGTDYLSYNLFGTGALPEWLVFAFVTVILTAGAYLTMWLGERITEYGVSNGISMIIFIGIIASGGQAIITMIGNIASKGFVAAQGWQLIVFIVVLVIVYAFIVFVDGGERKIPIQYAKSVKGQKMYGGQSTTFPIKVNASGVMPLIFAFSIMSLPVIIAQTFFAGSGFEQWISANCTGGWFYSIVLSILIFFFAYLYSSITFDPKDVAENLQKNGGFIPGIRPGKNTSEYIGKVVKRITLWGALFLAVMALIPSVVFGAINSDGLLVSSFGATSMLIAVSVALEFDKALQQQIMMRNYKGFLR